MDFVNALMFFLLLLTLILVFIGPWQSTCVDWARDELFTARDMVFDLASEGHLSFESEEYREFRDGINVLIRYAHKLGWRWILIYLIFEKHIVRSNDRKTFVSLMVSVENPRAREEMLKAYRKINRALTFLILLRSPLAWLVLLATRQRLKDRQRVGDNILAEARELDKVVLNSSWGLAV